MTNSQLLLGIAAVLGLLGGGLSVAIAWRFGALWLQAYMSDVKVRWLSLVGMSFRQVSPQLVVTAQIMGRQARLGTEVGEGEATARLEAHVLAGGDVMRVVRAIIAARRAGLELDFDRAAAIDLAGRDVLDAVQTSISPKVIDCPWPGRDGRTPLSAVAKNGVELLVRARVTVRTNLDQLIGGATEETIVARVCQGIVAAIGSSATHMEVLANPELISDFVLARGLDANTAFEIVSIDIADIDIGKNIGARLSADQAEAEMRMANARAAGRLAEAVATHQERRADVLHSRALLVAAECELPHAIADAFRAGHRQVKAPSPSRRFPAEKASLDLYSWTLSRSVN